MESRFSYTVVGVFVLLFGAALVGVVFWLYAGGPAEARQRIYHAYFDESVAGLTVNAPVTYKGVTVGRVLDIGLAPDGSGRVRVVLSLEETAPVRTDTVATLRMQGLTGLVQVELSGGSPGAPRLEARPPETVPVIPTQPSLITRFDTALTAVLADVDRAAGNVAAITDADSRRALRRTLDSVERSARLIADQMPAVEATLRQAAGASAEVAGLVRRLEQTAASVERMAGQATRLASAGRAAVEEAHAGVAQLKGQTLPEVNALLGEMRALAADLRRMSAELERQPGSLVWGRPAPAPGPGE